MKEEMEHERSYGVPFKKMCIRDRGYLGIQIQNIDTSMAKLY